MAGTRDRSHMPQRTVKNPPFIRTDFSDEKAWRELLAAVRVESEDGFLANISVVDYPLFDGIAADDLAQSVEKREPHHAVMFIADQLTLTHADRPILCIPPSQPQKAFRVIPSQLWGVENNLTLANMDWEDFSGCVDADGIFRGFV